MGLKNWIFNKETPSSNPIKFGRYTDLYKSLDKFKAWDKAVIAYNDDKFKDSYLYFLEYITNDNQKNVEISQDNNDELKFTFYQGSKKVIGFIDNQYFNAEAKIASFDKPNLTVFRSILEENYRLKYSKYCIDDDQNLTIVFQTSHLDANPYKLYYGLKEIATIADYKDDALIKKFEEFSPIDTGHINPVPSFIITAKYEYFRKELLTLKSHINTLNLSSHHKLGELVYMVAAFAYKMDCLLLPEGMLMQRLETLIDLSNEQISAPKLQGVNAIISELEALERKNEEDFKLEFYQSEYTFGLTNPVDHKHVINMIESNMEQLRYYVSKKNDVLANAICSYVLGKLMYDHALPAFDRDLIRLYYQITEPLLFSTSGKSSFTKRGTINKSAVIQNIYEIEDLASKTIKDITFKTDIIMWNKEAFAPSYLFMILQSMKSV